MNNVSETATSDHAGWDKALVAELAAAHSNGRVGTKLVSESNRVRVWNILLRPGQRLPFHKHVLDYFWTAVTDGRGRSRYQNGRASDVEYKSGDTKHLVFTKDDFMIHDLENTGTTDLIFTTVEFLDSANSPLSLIEQSAA